MANFSEFLRDTANKSEFFEFLTQKVSKRDYPNGKEVYITSGQFNMMFQCTCSIFNRKLVIFKGSNQFI